MGIFLKNSLIIKAIASPRKCSYGGIGMCKASSHAQKASSGDSPAGIGRPQVALDRDSPVYQHHLEDLMYHALKDDKFIIYYQPLYSIQDNNFTEAEALLRLQDESGRFVPPDEFIPIAEKNGMIMEISSMVLNKVAGYIRSMLSCGTDIDSISINLSAVDLTRPDLADHVLDIIRKNHISPNRIVLEITESILIRNYRQAGDQIREMSSEGIQFALDDFGTGYSNIANVIDLPFDDVKIDKSLIWDSIKNRKCNIVIRELTKAFKDIHLGVIAEGVETPEHDRFVRQCGCDRIQGFRYAKPMPSSRVYDYFGRKMA